MRQKEQKLWDTMKRNCPSDVWLQRVENMVTVGMPDLTHLVEGGITGWVELKAVTTPKRAGTRLMGDEGLNKDQINWHLKYTSMGGDSWVLIRDTGQRLYMLHGKYAAVMNGWPVEVVREHSSASSWDGIFNVLRGKK
jgi:hypothetical protein